MSKRKGLILGVLCFTLLFMGIGFALFSTTLNINGTATATGTFDVKITDVQYDTSNSTLSPTNFEGNIVVSQYDDEGEYVFETPSTTATLTAAFNEPGEVAVWTLTATNSGSVAAKISVNAVNPSDTSGAYKLQCYSASQDPLEGRELSANGGTTTFKCSITFDENHNLTGSQLEALENQNTNLQVTVTAVQSSGYEAPQGQVNPVDVSGTFYPYVLDVDNPTEYIIANPDGTGDLYISSQHIPFTYEYDNVVLTVYVMGNAEYYEYFSVENNTGFINDEDEIFTTNGGVGITPLSGFIYSDGNDTYTFASDGTVTRSSDGRSGNYAVINNRLYFIIYGNKYMYNIAQDYSSFTHDNDTFVKQN